MANIHCYKCGLANDASAKFCKSCGAPFQTGPQTAAQTGAGPITPPTSGQMGGNSAPPGSLESWVIGNSPECNIVISRPTISRRHCRLSRLADGFVLEDLGSSNGTFVNGTRISTPVRVSQSDMITLGREEPLPWPQPTPAPPPPRKQASGTVVERAIQFPPGAAPTGPTNFVIPPGPVTKTITIGRTDDNDVVLAYPIISSHHASIKIVGGQAYIEDQGSTNGTAIGAPQDKIKAAPLSPDDVVFFGSFRIPAARLLEGSLNMGDASNAVHGFDGKSEIVFGRDPASDRVLDYPMISWRHAKLTRSGSEFVVEDLGSSNGTFVNGERISGAVRVKPGDSIGLGSFSFKLTQDGRLEERDFRGNVTIEVQNVSIEVPGKKLLGNISLTIYPSEFVGLMGPSGAGKTTLMNALNGYTPPTSGAVLLNGTDLYRNYAQFTGHIGYVPQNDIMHGELTVGQALYYTARLRLPSDYSGDDIQKRVDEVCNQLDLNATKDVLIGSAEKKGISGGQRKRVNLAMELLTDPSVLFLDEPTSGLSSEDTLMVMRLLRQLADSGKTILLTIHQPSLEAYRLMDDVVIVSKDRGSSEAGCLAYFGPAYPDSVNFFNPSGVPNLKPGMEPTPDEVLRGLGKGKSSDWAQRYHGSRYKREYVDERAGKRPSLSAQQVAPKIPRRLGIAQLLTLVRRNVSIKARDTWNTLILMAQAPIIALLIVFIFGADVRKGVASDADILSWNEFTTYTAMTIFLMAVSAIWFGCSNAAREIVGEWAIYNRERMVNLKIPSYVFSKITVLGGLCFVQCFVMLTIVYFGCGLKGPFFQEFVILYLASLVGLGLGLTVSALARTSEVAVALIPLILIPMVIAGGALKPVHKMNVPMQAFTSVMASRWAFEGMLITESFGQTQWQRSATSDVKEDIAEYYFPLDEKNKGAKKARLGIPVAVGVLALMYLFLVMTIMVILKRRDIH